MAKKRTIVVMVGSDSDLPQCIPGLEYLQEAVDEDRACVTFADTASIHWNTEEVLTIARSMGNIGAVDVLITGAGMANHLTGTVDAFLRRTVRTPGPVVIGVAFESDDSEATKAAIYSIKYVPGTQVVYSDEQGDFIGEDGFLRACKYAVSGELPEITIPDRREAQYRRLNEALTKAREIKAKKQAEQKAKAKTS